MGFKKFGIGALVAALLALPVALTGCSSTAEQGSTASSSDHEALTWMTFTHEYEDFYNALKEKYPEVNIEFVSYSGHDSTNYGATLLEAGEITDIYSASLPPENTDLMKENLLDLSGDDYINNLSINTLSDVTVDGGVYMVPTNLSFYGVYYNKTLFEKNGWEVPNSLDEVEALIPQIEAAGCTVSTLKGALNGLSFFTYFYNTEAGDFFSTVDGIKWAQDYLSFNATAEGNLNSAAEQFKHLVDIGFIPKIDPNTSGEAFAKFQEGNTAFMFSNLNDRFTQNEDGTGDQYAYMPYLSQDGSNNIVVTKANFYYGISNKLTGQKLEDAKKVMSFICSEEGQRLINNKENTITTLKGDTVDEDSPVYEVSKLVDEGKSMPMVYNGWLSYYQALAEDLVQFTNGDLDVDGFVAAFDTLNDSVKATGGLPEIAKVEENLTLEQTAQLVGAAYAEATGADCALISLGGYHGYGLENSEGVNGQIWKGVKFTDNVIRTFTPLASSKNVMIATLTGKQIKQWVEEGYFKGDDPTPFEYVLVTKDGATLDDDTEYKVAVHVESDARVAEGKIVESDVNTNTAIADYCKKIGTISSKTIEWK